MAPSERRRWKSGVLLDERDQWWRQFIQLVEEELIRLPLVISGLFGDEEHEESEAATAPTEIDC